MDLSIGILTSIGNSGIMNLAYRVSMILVSDAMTINVARIASHN